MVPEKLPDSSQNLGRGLRLIEHLSDYPNGCPLAKIAEETGINKSTAHRLLKSLQSLGYVSPTATPGSYRLTSKLVTLGYKTYSSLNIIKIADPHLEKINLEIGETVNFSTREGNSYILIYKLEPTTGILRTRFYVGQRLHLYCSAMGKVYLAYSPDSVLRKYWREECETIIKRTPHSITDIDEMRRELARIREEGISYDREENELGVVCIAAPVFGLQRRVEYALSVSLPAFRLDDRRRLEVEDAVREAAAAVSHEIGGGVYSERELSRDVEIFRKTGES